MEGKAEALRHAVPPSCVQEENQRERGGGHTANEQVAERQVEDHEVKVRTKLAKRWVEEGQKHHHIAIGAQKEDEDEEGGAKGQSGSVDHSPA